MPTYEYECTGCHGKFEQILPLAESRSPQNCPTCGQTGERLVSSVGFVLKGDSWPGKALRVKSQMARRREGLAQKERDHVAPGMTLAPNVDGERVDTWSEAQHLAASKGKDTSSYMEQVVKEQRGSP